MSRYTQPKVTQLLSDMDHALRTMVTAVTPNPELHFAHNAQFLHVVAIPRAEAAIKAYKMMYPQRKYVGSEPPGRRSPLKDTTDFYAVDERGPGGCAHCGASKFWTIIFKDNGQDCEIGTAWGDKWLAEDICALMNMAYDAGLETRESGQAEIATVTIQEGKITGGVLKAPGLPDGEHDLFCANTATCPPLEPLASAEPRPSVSLSLMVDRFLAWPLPKSVCSDLCVTYSNYPSIRCGTSLLSPDEARLMLEYVTRPEFEPPVLGSSWEENAKFLLDQCTHTIRVREGGGPEDLKHSFVMTFIAMENKLKATTSLQAENERLQKENIALHNLANNLRPGPISVALGGAEREAPYRTSVEPCVIGDTKLLSDEAIRSMTIKVGGSFHGPNVEHASIEEQAYFRLMRQAFELGRRAARRSAPPPNEQRTDSLIDDLVHAVRRDNDASDQYTRQAVKDARVALLSAMTPATPPSAAAHDVLEERERQKTSEGWTPEHDDEHKDGVMAQAAACYALRAANLNEAAHDFWPWTDKRWKPKDTRRDLVRAGALIVAEIERLDRVASTKRGDV